MAVFRGSYEEKFTVDVPLEKARAFFSDLENIGRNYDGVDRWEKVDDRTLHIFLKPQAAVGVTFRGEHVCKYEFGDRHLAWKTEPDGNVRSQGRATFEPAGENRTTIVHRDEIECEMDINRFVAKALQPIVGRSIEKGVKAYLERMRNDLKRSS